MSLLLISRTSLAANQNIQSFSKAKKALEKKVYVNHQETIYCAAKFNNKKEVAAPSGFNTTKYIKRAKKIEWEHIVPAENFGRTFVEWREGHKKCVTRKGNKFKGRKCAEKVNLTYRYMQADMFNLYPAIGAVNALRSNYNFTMLSTQQNSFGNCEMKIENKKAEPPKNARGRIARTYLYMDATYPNYSMSNQQKQLMYAWDQQFPVNQWECTRAKLITSIQQSENIITQKKCEENHYW